MQIDESTVFISYARQDKNFVLKLVRRLRSKGAKLWLDQLDIPGGICWDDAVEQAINTCGRLLVVLSPASTKSDSVMDEVGFALDEGKQVVPVVYQSCVIPFRLRRVHYIDFTENFDNGIKQLLNALNMPQELETSEPIKHSKEDTRDISQYMTKEQSKKGLFRRLPVALLGLTILVASIVALVVLLLPDEDGATLEDVKRATIRIEATGFFQSSDFGQQLETSQGSGFIIEPSGIAVTNNHVVTGAATIKVWVGDESEAHHARILGVSECHDLAILDIDGDGYEHLEWYDDKPKVGIDVYVAGYPLGDPEFTLTRGIISKENANGDSSWASVYAVIEHDAIVNPGNSGGPLVSGDGEVIGINYAFSNYNQYYAISCEDVVPIIEQLQSGKDVCSIGVNGEAINPNDGQSGIWVVSLESGSLADQVGVEPGDIITKLEGQPLGSDGTFRLYCDILRSHDPEDVLDIEVLRSTTDEVLKGQLNGHALEQSDSLEQKLGGIVSVDNVIYDYISVTDDSGVLTMMIPSEWDDIDGSPMVSDGEIFGVAIEAAPNLEDYYDYWSVPGVLFIASKSLSLFSNDEALDFLKSDIVYDCQYDDRYDYDDGYYTGLFDIYTSCGGLDTVLLMIAAEPENHEYMILLMVTIVSEADLEATDVIIDTFFATGELP